MTIPEGITEAAWEAAFDPAEDAYMAFDYETARAIVARAIQAAQEAEREACAAIADERAAICEDAVSKIDAGKLYAGIPTARATEQCAQLEALHIARLIRRKGA
jgi:hypothetical protein